MRLRSASTLSPSHPRTFTVCSPVGHQRSAPGPLDGHDRCPEMAKVLIVEDDVVIGQGMARHLAAAGFDPLWVTKGEQGLARLRYERPDVCVLDLMIPQTDGWSIIEAARGDGIAT